MRRHKRAMLLPWAGGVGVIYLLLDRFTTPASAPLTTPRTAEPGPGSWTIVDTGNKLSVSAGQLVSSSGTGAADPYIISVPTYARIAGRAVMGTISNSVASFCTLGWSHVATPNVPLSRTSAYFRTDSTLRYADANGQINGVATSFGVGTYEVACVLRTAGGFLLVKGGQFASWTLLYVSNSSADTPLYAAWATNNSASAAFNMDDFRVVDFGDAWTTDYGIATDRKAVTIAGDTIACNADCLLEHTITAATGVIQDLQFRRVDDNNCWILRATAPGTDTVLLIEKNAGVETTRSTVAQTWTNATQYRIVVAADTQTITSWVSNTLKNTYASASFQQTATGAKVDRAGTNLVSWPRRPTVPNI